MHRIGSLVHSDERQIVYLTEKTGIHTNDVAPTGDETFAF